MFVVDTNVLVYAANTHAALHERCRQRLDEWRAQAGPWYLTWGIIYEFIRVTTHPRVFRKPWTAAESWRFIAALLASPSLGLLGHGERHAVLLAEFFQKRPETAGNLVYDAHTAVLMAEHGIRVIYTRDTDFHRFPSIEVRDPGAS